MKKIFALALILTSYVFAKPTPSGHKIDDEPLTWSIPLYDELRTYFPSIDTKKVYYMVVANNNIFRGSKIDTRSTDKTVDVARGSLKANVRADGQRANPKDVITISYNQKLKVYIPELEKIVWLAPARGQKIVTTPDDVTDVTIQAQLKKAIDPEKQVQFKKTKDAKPEDIEAEEVRVQK